MAHATISRVSIRCPIHGVLVIPSPVQGMAITMLSNVTTRCPMCGAVAPIDDGWFDEERRYHALSAGLVIPPMLVEQLRQAREEVRQANAVSDAALELLDFVSPELSKIIRRLPAAAQRPVYVLIVSFLILVAAGTAAEAGNSILEFVDRLLGQPEIEKPLTEEEVATFRLVSADQPELLNVLDAALLSTQAAAGSSSARAQPSLGERRQRSPSPPSQLAKAARRPRSRPEGRREDRRRDPPPGKKR